GVDRDGLTSSPVPDHPGVFSENAYNHTAHDDLADGRFTHVPPARSSDWIWFTWQASLMPVMTMRGMGDPAPTFTSTVVMAAVSRTKGIGLRYSLPGTSKSISAIGPACVLTATMSWPSCRSAMSPSAARTRL